MFFFDLLFVLILTLILTFVFAVGFRRRSWGGGLIIFFLVLFLATWAGGLWITPIGPVLWGITWLPFILVGIVMALLLTAVMPPDRVRPREGGGVETQPHSDAGTETETMVALDGLMWILILGLLAAVIIGYLA